uniref:PH domain-containing protein n=1 Tax=Globisporangium ultimum (strain ATCC 200006 / CBS 805.95 / DAOM BR144) TaxID=431595 RepID=K3WN17_GLOUD
MSAHQPQQPQQFEEEEEIQVTSPTSYALRESFRRSSSAGYDFVTGAPSVRSNDRQTSRMSRGSFFNRAPPPAPPQHPPQGIHIPPAPMSAGSTSGGLNGLARPSSNPSLAAMSQASEASYSHGNSLGPTSFSTTPMGSSSSNNQFNGSNYNNNGQATATTPGHRRSSSRRSIFSRETFMLSREKESPSTIPEGAPMEIKCEGFLTKRGHVFTNWKTRYFVLRGDVLEYFSGEEKNKKYGSVTVAKVAPWSGEAHGFMFYTTKQIPYYVYAASEAERSKWLRALKEFVVEPEEVSCEGYLTRRGHLVPSQRMAYYVLNGASLRHYADQSAYRDNQSAIAEVEVRSVAPWDGEPNGLMFQTSTGNVFYASTDTVGEQQKWLQTVKRSNATAPEPVSCAGYLTKQGHKRKSWKKRYFILRGNLISYYSDYDLANSAKGKPLAEVAVEDVQKWDGEPFGFMFMTSEQVPYYVYADNDRERNKWMNALSKLTAVVEEPHVEKKRCPNCNAVLTGSRFCGACGHNLRGTTVGENNARRNHGDRSSTGDGMDSQDDPELDDDNAFDELEALSEGARTLLLAVMQTPEGVDIGDRDGQFPSRATNAKNTNKAAEPSTLQVQVAENMDDETEQEEKTKPAISPIATKPAPVSPVAPRPKTPEPILAETFEYSNSPPSPNVVPKPPTPPASRNKSNNHKKRDSEKPTRQTLTPNFAIVEDGETKNSSFTSFGGDSDEESKAEPQPVPVPERKSSRASGVHMGNMGRRKTLSMLAAESSSDDDDNETKLPTKPPPMAYAKGEEEDESKQEEEPRERKSSVDSLELDMGGIALLEEVPKSSANRAENRSSVRMSERSSKKDLYHFMERELDFTPQFIPSADAPVRCRFYSSMAYASAKKVIMFISDSGPLGLWRHDVSDQTTTVDHKWSMTRYFSRAQEEGYGVVVCNPFSNSVVVYEAGGFEREVPIPNSSTPKEHVLFVWEQFVSKCKGQVSIIAFARGGALVKSILETYETSARDKIHRIAFIESKHEIDPSESFGIRELLGSRSINWEASFEPLGGQIVDSQARVGCVCLSIGYMPENTIEPENNPKMLEKSEDPAFAFIEQA